MSDEKTQIIDVRDGFDSLSRHYERKSSVVYSRQSDAAVERFEATMKEFISKYKGSQQSLIEALNKKLSGFAGYHRVTEATDAFRHLDVAVNAFLLELCQVKHPKLPQKKIIEKYWYKRSDGQYVYALKDKIECHI